jgi:hypothetical protein
MEHTYFPVELETVGASVRYHDLVEGVFQVGDITVRAQYLNHPALTLGYRLEADGASVVYACDHEPHGRGVAEDPSTIEGQDRRHAEFLAGADLVIHDAQYLRSEYAAKVGWGHSTIDYAIAVSQFAGAKRLALTHHDPTRTDAALDALGETLRARGDLAGLEVFAAAEGQEIELRGEARDTPQPVGESARFVPAEALVGNMVLLAVKTPSRLDALRRALEAEDVRMRIVAPADAALSAAGERPSLVVLEDSDAAPAIARSIQALGGDLPIVLVGGAETSAHQDGLFEDRLVEPFTPSYARARLRAALLRRASRWVRADTPADEPARLRALRSLGILDTPAEERFDRITRLAAAVFDVPVALISLVDENRQWFKSACGIGVSETPRDQSFCAHAVARRSPLVIPDAMLDERFADNPVVTDLPRVRFYAGQPLFLPDGSCVGTLCILDTRPRDLDAAALDRLKDLADLAREELIAHAATA